MFLAITLKHVLNNFIASKRIIIPTMTKTIICKAKQEKKIRQPCSHFILLGNCVCVCVCVYFSRVVDISATSSVSNRIIASLFNQQNYEAVLLSNIMWAKEFKDVCYAAVLFAVPSTI